MKAIRTHYVGPTNTKPGRIVATAEGGHRLSISYDHEFSQEGAHAKAAIALCHKLGWSGALISGGFADCYVFCFDSSNRYPIPGTVAVEV